MFKNDLIKIAREAGRRILEIQQGQSFSILKKSDNTPVTQADLVAHKFITDALRSLDTKYPIISEESCEISWTQRKNWHRYWLVDPLDGTKEFIKRNGEFTVNIALIEHGEPIIGVVYAPAKDDMYYGERDCGAELNGEAISVAQEQPDTLRVVGSRSHPSEETIAWLEQQGKPYELVPMGSSLKICLVAQGEADVYPRLGPTSEWDTGAAHAVLNAAGGIVTEVDGSPLKYNQKESFLNPYFIAKSAG